MNQDPAVFFSPAGFGKDFFRGKGTSYRGRGMTSNQQQKNGCPHYHAFFHHDLILIFIWKTKKQNLKP
jgi:hypothetical protein